MERIRKHLYNSFIHNPFQMGVIMRKFLIFNLHFDFTQRKQFSINNAFTFIEMIVVIGIMSIALPTLYAIFFLILQQQMKIIRLAEVKRQGDFVVNTIESLVKKNAFSIHSGIPTDGNKICTPPNSTTTSGPLYFKDRSGNYFYFDIPVGTTKISSESAGQGIDLTSSKVVIDSASFTQNCTISGFSAPYVTYSFDLCYNTDNTCAPSSTHDILHFETTAALPHY